MDATNSIMSKPILHQSLDTPQFPLLKSHKRSDLKIQIGSLVPCKKQRVTKNALHSCSLVDRRWENLDSDILRLIYSRIPVQDLFLNVSSVCKSWEATCWDYLFWSRNVLDLSDTGVGLGVTDISDALCLYKFKSDPLPGMFGWLDSPEKYNNMATSLLRKLRRILEDQNMQYWRDTIQTVILPYDLEISDKHLIYIAERTPHLQQLLLLCPSKITVSGFTRAIKKWKRVKDIHLGPFNDDVFAYFIEEMGRKCQELESLHIHQDEFRLDLTIARVIAKCLPGLKKIEFELGHIRPSGFSTLFNMCLQLKEVYFNICQLKPDFEASAGYEHFYSHDIPHNFYLTWTVDGEGLKWEVEPHLNVKRCMESLEKLKVKRTMEDLWHPEFLKYEKARLQSVFEKWVMETYVRPRRQIEQP